MSCLGESDFYYSLLLECRFRGKVTSSAKKKEVTERRATKIVNAEYWSFVKAAPLPG